MLPWLLRKDLISLAGAIGVRKPYGFTTLGRQFPNWALHSHARSMLRLRAIPDSFAFSRFRVETLSACRAPRQSCGADPRQRRGCQPRSPLQGSNRAPRAENR